jgi:mannose-6-phosphate isomerase-like protein (cupin superfamily)
MSSRIAAAAAQDAGACATIESTMTADERVLLGIDDLPGNEHAHELEGVEFGDVPFSIIVVHSGPGAGPRLHRHDYAEVFVVESGQATFRLGDEEIVVSDRRIVIAHSMVPHGFRNTGEGELRLIAIHGAPRFGTEWLEGADPIWSSKPR